MYGIGIGTVRTIVLLLLLLPWPVFAQQCPQADLNVEFTTDPTARGYAACAPGGDITGLNNNDQCTLEKFNAACTGNPACKVDNIMTKEQVMETLVDSVELETLARSTTANDVARKSQLGWLLQLSSYNMAKGSWQQKWKNVFAQGAGASPITNAAINAAQQKDAPRSQIVCHRPGTTDDVSCGLRGTGCTQ